MSKYRNLNPEDLAIFQEEDGSVRRFISCPDLTTSGIGKRDHGVFLFPPEVTDTDIGELWEAHILDGGRRYVLGNPLDHSRVKFTIILKQLGALAMPQEVVDQKTPIRPSTFDLPKLKTKDQVMNEMAKKTKVPVAS